MRKASYHLPLLAAIFAFAVAVFHFNNGVELVDEGVLNMGAWRISEGQVPYRDFFIPYTPFSFYFLSVFYKLFGVSILTGRFAAVLISCLLTITALLLCRKVIKSPLFASIPLIIMTQAGMSMWHFASHHWIGNLFTVLSLLFLCTADESGRSLDPFLSGLFAAMTFLTINDQGVYVLAFFLISIFVFSDKEKRWKRLIAYSAGASAVLLPSLIYLLVKVPVGELFYDLVVFPFTAYKQTESNRMELIYPFKELANVWNSGMWKDSPLYNITGLLTSLFITLLPLFSIPAAVWLFIREKGNKLKISSVLLASLAMVLTASRRWAPINLMWAAFIPSVVFSMALYGIHEGARKALRRAAAFSAVGVISLFFIFGILKTSSLFDASTHIEVKGKAGSLYLGQPVLASKLNGLLKAIEEIIPENEPFLDRSIPLINFLTLRRIPTRFDLFKPPDYTPEKQMKEVIGDLEKKKVRFVVCMAFVKDDANIFEDYLLKNFEPAWDNGQFRIYKRVQGGSHGADGQN